MFNKDKSRNVTNLVLGHICQRVGSIGVKVQHIMNATAVYPDPGFVVREKDLGGVKGAACQTLSVDGPQCSSQLDYVVPKCRFW